MLKDELLRTENISPLQLSSMLLIVTGHSLKNTVIYMAIGSEVHELWHSSFS